MTSRDFFGRSKGCKDINIEMFNAFGELIYELHTTSFKGVTLLIDEEIYGAIEDYKKRWKFRGSPTRVELYTTPSYNLCIATIDGDGKIVKKEYKGL